MATKANDAAATKANATSARSNSGPISRQARRTATMAPLVESIVHAGIVSAVGAIPRRP
jgi:hypothetical protein